MVTPAFTHFNLPAPELPEPGSHQRAEASPAIIRAARSAVEDVGLGPTAGEHQTQEPTNPAKKGVKPKKKVLAPATFSGSLKLPELFTSELTALALGVSPGTLAVWRSTGRYNLPFVKIGRKVLYKREDLAAFIKSRTYGTASNAI